jgi:predicted DNA-binding protein
MEKFNQQKYIQEYNKDHYKTFKVDLKKEELEELNKLLKKKKMTKATFLRQSIEELKKKD